VQTTGNILKGHSVLPSFIRKKHTGKNISDSILSYVTHFYEGDECSRIFPGMKVNSEGVREHKQKRLVLSNFNELYEKLEDSHPNANIGFSKLCE
jgi:hypothetical protein